MSVPNDEAAMLLRLAEQDRLAFVTLCANPDIALRTAAFHAQQAVEKFLKAVLAARGRVFPPIHDLVKLAQLLEGAGFPSPVSLDALKRINPYAVVFRYDDRNIETITREEALAVVDAVSGWAKKALSG